MLPFQFGRAILFAYKNFAPYGKYFFQVGGISYFVYLYFFRAFM